MKTMLISTFALFTLSLFSFLPHSVANDYTTQGLPDGARMRLGKGYIKQIAYSPDGTRLAVATFYGVWLYDGVTGEELGLLSSIPTEICERVAFSPDGKTLANTGSRNSYLWDVDQKQIIRTFKHPLSGPGSAEEIAISPDGKTLATGHRAGNWILLWDVETGGQKDFHGRIGGERITNLVFSPDSKTLAGASDSLQKNNLALWDMETLQVKHNLRAHRGRVYKLAFSPDGKLLASADDKYSAADTPIYIWDVETGEIKHSIRVRDHGKEFSGPVQLVEFSPDGKTLTTVTKSIAYWNVATWQIKSSVEIPSNRTAISPDGKTAVATERDHLSFWDLDTGERIHHPRKERRVTFSRLLFNPNGNTVVSFDEYGILRWWDAGRGEPKRTVTAHLAHDKTGAISSKLSPDGKTLMIKAAGGNVIAFWDMETGEKKRTIYDHQRTYGAAFTPDSETLMVMGHGSGIDFWDTETGEKKRNLRATYPHTAFSPDGKKAAGWKWRDDDVSLLNLETGEEKYPLAHSDDVAMVKFSPDSRTLAISSGEYGDIVVVLRDAETGETKRTIPVFDQRFWFSPDSKTLAGIGHIDMYVDMNLDFNVNNVVLWDVETGKVKRVLVTPNELGFDRTRVIAFSPDSKTLARKSEEFITFWNAETGEIKRTLPNPNTACGPQLVFSPDGKSLASDYFDTTDGHIVVWDVEMGEIKHRFTQHIGGNCDSEYEFTPDSRTLLSPDSLGKTVLLWNIAPPLADTRPEPIAGDVNGDGAVNIQDLVAVAGAMGQTGENDADVNGDGVVNIQDLVAVAAAMAGATAAPAITHHQVKGQLTSADVREWITQAQAENLTDPKLQRGIRFLHYLLAMLTLPEETKLLANYPNPFNPETWIPYQLAKPAKVTLTIYEVGGNVVRTLALGHQPAGFYEGKSRSAYWDGRNSGGEPVASGIYFYTLSAGDFSATRKMLIRK